MKLPFKIGFYSEINRYPIKAYREGLNNIVHYNQQLNKPQRLLTLPINLLFISFVTLSNNNIKLFFNAK